MNLVIDVGNSYAKLAIFKELELEFKEVVTIEILVEKVFAIKEKYPMVKQAIVSSVSKIETNAVDKIKEIVPLIYLQGDTKLPFTNLYKTPHTLGVDRIALVANAVNKFPKTNVLIIDAGTCITYDFISAKNEYHGGAISPGLRMRYISLNNLTANLPLLETKMPDKITGDTTKSAIHSGVIFGVLKEIEGVIDVYNDKYPDLTVILTGGDCNFLSKQLKSSIFANSNFLLEGLNFILQYNSNE